MSRKVMLQNQCFEAVTLVAIREDRVGKGLGSG